VRLGLLSLPRPISCWRRSSEGDVPSLVRDPEAVAVPMGCCQGLRVGRDCAAVLSRTIPCGVETLVAFATLEGVSMYSNSSSISSATIRSEGLPPSFSPGTSFGSSFRFPLDHRFPDDFVIMESSGLVRFVDIGVLGDD